MNGYSSGPVYRRALAGTQLPLHLLQLEERRNVRTMESLCFLQEPFQPASFEPKLHQLPHASALVDFRVMRELRSLDQREDNGVLQTDQRGSDAIQGEGVPREHEILLHLAETFERQPKLIEGPLAKVEEGSA